VGERMNGTLIELLRRVIPKLDPELGE
jgi:hypothetical protein